MYHSTDTTSDTKYTSDTKVGELSLINPFKQVTDGNARSWFCVFNNPLDHGFQGTPQEICDSILEIWMLDNPQRCCVVLYCVSADGLEHCHAVFEDTKTMRFSLIKKLFPSMHIQPTKGNKQEAEDYINKRGKWEEKGEKILAKSRHGEVKGYQGQRRDIDIIGQMIEQGKTPKEILFSNFANYRYETFIRKAYFDKRDAETTIVRDVFVRYHVGESGSGKSYVAVQLAEKFGEGNVFVVTSYENGCFDGYNGEPILVLDEFRGHMKFSVLMHILDKYKATVHARYSNIKALWTEVHICSVLPPERIYSKMVTENCDCDSYEQFRRRITTMVYHWKDEMGRYRQYELPMIEYTTYDVLRGQAKNKTPEALFQFAMEETKQLEFEEIADNDLNFPF